MRSRKFTFTSLINRGEIIWCFLAKQVSRTVENRKTSTHFSVHESLWCRINKRLKFIALPRSRSNTFTYFCVEQQQRTGGMWEIITTLFQAIKSLKVPVWNVNFAINYVRSQNRCRFRLTRNCEARECCTAWVWPFSHMTQSRTQSDSMETNFFSLFSLNRSIQEALPIMPD